MTPERFRQIEELYHAARKATAAKREALLALADPELRGEVESLLLQPSSGEFLDRPAIQNAPQLIEDSTVTALTAGACLGPYRIEGKLGEGGMGEVFRAVDTRLGRAVAIKITREQFSARFEREARAISSLNHPNICALHDVGPDYLVMELVEGETLAARLKKGPLPIDQTMRYGVEIADALAEAHSKGIIHRDLKPGNIMLTKIGVKVLDFGLAKLQAQPGESQTASNIVMGTPAYMAPEQVEGKECDARTDIYTLGLVLYEIATGKKASPVQGQPIPMEGLPEKLAHVVERCLQQDPDDRWQTAKDVKAELEWASKSQPIMAPAVATRARRTRAWMVAGVGVLILGTVLGWIFKPVPEQTMVQLEINPPEGAKFVSVVTPFALSPNGKRIVFLATGKDGKQMLWVRPIDSTSAVAIPGTENGQVPFWSPDDRWVGFSANGKLQKVDVVSGGQPQVICDIQGRAGGTWSREGIIVFDQGNKPLQRVSASGGIPTPVFPLDAARGEATHLAPYFFPDGQHILYYSQGRTTDSKLASLDGKVNRVLLPGVLVATYAPNPRGGGSILYNPRGQLLARPFDVSKGEFTGQPEVIAEGVGSGRWWYASADGLLAFRHNYGTQFQLAWFGRDGRMQGIVGDPGLLSAPRISPDQKTIVFARTTDQNADIWTFDLTRNTSTRFTFEPSLDAYPIWSPDGKSIIYFSRRNSASFVVERSANGSGAETILASHSSNYLCPSGISHDARWLILTEASPIHSTIVLQPHGDANKAVRIQEHDEEIDGAISPDGRWLLYSSKPAGRREVLVQSVPKEAGGSASASGKWQISMAGGGQPTWRADGKEIFFVAPDGMMMAVPVESSANFFRPGAPKPLFRTHLEFDPPLLLGTVIGIRQYDVSADGQRFLLNQHVADSTDAPITLVVNWPRLLTK